MNWLPLTADDLADARAAKLIEALRTKALGLDQTDPLPRAAETVVAELRAAIGFSGRYTLDADAKTIPASLKELAVQRVVRVAKQRVLLALTDAEQKDEALYQRRIEQLAAGQWPIEKPDTLDVAPTAQTTSETPRIAAREKRWSRSRRAGEGC